MRCAILELEANLETFQVWFIFGGRLPQTRGVFSTVLLKSVAVCLYASGGAGASWRQSEICNSLLFVRLYSC